MTATTSERLLTAMVRAGVALRESASALRTAGEAMRALRGPR